MATRNDLRYSQYSIGAPSIQPSLAPTFSTQPPSPRSSTTPATMSGPRTSGTPYRSVSNSEKLGSDSTASTYYPSSSSSYSSSDPTKSADLKTWSGALDRMQDSRLDRQRYVLSAHKSEEVSKLALGAKVERALSRRMVGQDASFSSTSKPKSSSSSGNSNSKKQAYDEKRTLELRAT